MKNKEHYKDEILEIAIEGNNFAFIDGKICECQYQCQQCEFYRHYFDCCDMQRKEWAESEYIGFNTSTLCHKIAEMLDVPSYGDDLTNALHNLPYSSVLRKVLTLLYIKNENKGRKKRFVYISTGMSRDDSFLMETDAPKEAIEEWGRNYNKEVEDGESSFLKPLSEKYYVRLLYDADAMEVYEDEFYDLLDYMQD